MSKAAVEVRYSEPLDRFTQGRISLVLYHPFFGTLAMVLKLIRNETLAVLAATDGAHLMYNPARCSILTMPEIIFVWAHEVMHCAMGHHVRRGNRDHDLWNIACDYVINYVLVDAGLQMPRGVLYDLRFKDMSAEQVYDILFQEYQQQQQQNEEEEDDNEERESDQDSSEQDQEGDNEGSSEGDSASQESGEDQDECDDCNEDSGDGDGGDQDTDGDASEDDSSVHEDQEAGSSEDASESSGESEQESDEADEGVEQGKGHPSRSIVPADDPRLQASRMTGTVEDFQGDENTPDDNIVTQTQRDNEEQSWRTVVIDCAQVAKAAGNLPGSIATFVQQMKAHKVPWTELFRNFMERSTQSEYTWKLPNRHYIVRDLYAPSLNKGSIENGVIAIDTSGSTTNYWPRFSEEAGGVLQDFDTELTFLQFDTAITKVDEISSADGFPERYEMRGGGGTYFAPPFKYIEQNNLDPKFMVVFTDGYLCDAYPPEPSYPVFWIMTPDGKSEAPPYGEVVWMEQ